MACSSCSRGLSETKSSNIEKEEINDPTDNLQHANASRKLAASELLLYSRHHLSYPNARCTENCEPTHLLTAQAALEESYRLETGDDEDKQLAYEIGKINVYDNPKENQQKARSITKQILSKIQENGGSSTTYIPSHETQQNESNAGKILLILGGLTLGAIIIYNLTKE